MNTTLIVAVTIMILGIVIFQDPRSDSYKLCATKSDPIECANAIYGDINARK